MNNQKQDTPDQLSALQIFENEELKLKIRIMRDSNDCIYFNAEDTAVGFGWIQTQTKKSKLYTSVRWETINGYCKEFGFPSKLGKDDYIPESLFYRLAMKANNASANKFQNWLATKVLPQIRKTGGTENKSIASEDKQNVAEPLKENNIAIKIDFNSDLPTVSARDLHEALGIKTKFATWFPRMVEYGFNENVDYKSCYPNLGSENHGGQNMIDYQISIDMAKQICMIQRTELGKQYRQYFLEIEKKWNSPDLTMARAVQLSANKINQLSADLTVAKVKIEEQQQLIEQKNDQIKQQEEKINQMKPALEQYNTFLNCKGVISLLNASQSIKTKRNIMMRFLRDQKVLNQDNTPRSYYLHRDYFEVKLTIVNGFQNATTYVTATGVIFLYKYIKKYLKLYISDYDTAYACPEYTEFMQNVQKYFEIATA